MHWYQRDNFAAYFQLIKDFENNSPLRKALSNGDVYSLSDVDEYICLLKKYVSDEYENEYVKNIRIFPVVRRNFTKKEIHDNWADRVVRARLIERREKIIESGEAPTYFLRSPYSPKDSYFHMLSKQLYGYLYADKFLENDRKITLKKKMMEFIKIGAEINELIISTGSQGRIPRFYFNGRSSERIEQHAEAIEVERNSSNLAERIFVKEMINIHNHFYKTPKLSRIQDLMCLPFFARQLDTSTISRINAKLQEQKRANIEARKAMAKEQSE